jgi:hypothetical protein
VIANPLLLSLTQLLFKLQTTLYVFVVEGLTVILAPVYPSVHLYVPEEQPDAESVVLERGQMLVAEVIIVGDTGLGITVTVAVKLLSP